MDYSIITEEILGERLNSLPVNLRQILESPDTAKTIERLSREHYLDKERVITLEQLAGLVLMGFISRPELVIEIEENLRLNPKHAGALAKDIASNIFEPVKDDLDATYEPIGEPRRETSDFIREIKERETKPPEKLISLEDIGGKVGVEGQEQVTAPQAEKETKPLILHEEKPIAEEAKRPLIRGFSLPFKFFRSEKRGKETKPPAKAKIEVPEEAKRVVHYSELNTPLPQFGKQEEIINLETLTPIKAPEPTNFPPKPDIAVPKKIEVKIETPPQETPKKVEIKKEEGKQPTEEKSKKFWPLNFLSKKSAEEPPEAKPVSPAGPASEPSGQPKLEGNIVDLRSR